MQIPTAAQQADIAQQATQLAQAYAGFKEIPQSVRPHRAAAFAPGAAAFAPPVFDWRPRGVFSPIQNQGTCYACTGFALAATIEANLHIAQPGNGISVSAGFLHTCIGHAADVGPTVICQSGCDMYQVLESLRGDAYAAATPGDYPYPSTACPAAQRIATIRDFNEITDAVSAKMAIAGTGPVAADLYVWEDFFSYTTQRAAVYQPDTSGAGPYLHSICVVGYDFSGWIVRNSFGANWGDGTGYGTIAYGASCGLIGSTPPAGRSSRSAYVVAV